MACDVYGNLLKDCCHVMWQLSLRMNDGKQQFGGNKMGVGAYKSSVQAPFLWKCRRRNSAVFDENFRQVGRVYSNLYMGMSLVYAFWRTVIVKRNWKQDKKFIIVSRHIAWRFFAFNDQIQNLKLYKVSTVAEKTYVTPRVKSACQVGHAPVHGGPPGSNRLNI